MLDKKKKLASRIIISRLSAKVSEQMRVDDVALLLEGLWVEDDVVDVVLQQDSTQLVAEVREVLAPAFEEWHRCAGSADGPIT